MWLAFGADGDVDCRRRARDGNLVLAAGERRGVGPAEEVDGCHASCRVGAEHGTCVRAPHQEPSQTSQICLTASGSEKERPRDTVGSLDRLWVKHQSM